MKEEMLDVIDTEDRVIGQNPRSEVHQLGFWHRGAHVFLFSPNGKMLIQKRSADRKLAASLLDCSVSEHVKAGEDYLEAAVRGLSEELGLEGIDLSPIAKIRMEYGPNDNEVSTIFEGRVTSQNIRFDPVEISEIFFMEMDEIKEGIFKSTKLFCPWFTEIMKWYFGLNSKLEILEKT